MLTKLEHFQIFDDLLKDIYKLLNNLEGFDGKKKEYTSIRKFLNYSLSKTSFLELKKLKVILEGEYENELAKWYDIQIDNAAKGLLSEEQIEQLDELKMIENKNIII